jgi:hypothetical protein
VSVGVAGEDGGVTVGAGVDVIVGGDTGVKVRVGIGAALGIGGTEVGGTAKPDFLAKGSGVGVGTLNHEFAEINT